MTTGKVFNIQRFSTHDGPGIRTTVFLSGCSLRCRWCHNPEGLETKPHLQYDASKCLFCGACQQVCPAGCHSFPDGKHMIDRKKCLNCGKCIAICPAKALQMSYQEYAPHVLADIVLKDRLFYQAEGGVTFSGGEPLLQPDFIRETASIAKEKGLSTVAIDTAGNVPWEAFEKVLPIADYFLFDIKAATPTVHKAGTGCDNTLIQENLRKLDQQGTKIFIRIPVIPGINDAEDEMKAIAAIALSVRSAQEIRLIPYHTFGREKYQTVGYDTPELWTPPTEEKMAKLNAFFAR